MCFIIDVARFTVVAVRFGVGCWLFISGLGWSDWLGAVVLRFWVGVSGWFWGFVSVVILLLCLRLVVINSVVLIKFYFYLIKF